MNLDNVIRLAPGKGLRDRAAIMSALKGSRRLVMLCWWNLAAQSSTLHLQVQPLVGWLEQNFPSPAQLPNGIRH